MKAVVARTGYVHCDTFAWSGIKCKVCEWCAVGVWPEPIHENNGETGSSSAPSLRCINSCELKVKGTPAISPTECGER